MSDKLYAKFRQENHRHIVCCRLAVVKYIYNIALRKSFNILKFPKNKQAEMALSEPFSDFGIVCTGKISLIADMQDTIGGIWMGIIVSKFGGSSIADADGFRRVREIIAANKKRRHIVLSAPGKRSAGDRKITDMLVCAHELYAAGQDGSAVIRVVKERFASIIRDLSLRIDADEFLGNLDNDVRYSPDLAASRGEYLCARLFSIFSGIPFADASSLIQFDEHGYICRDETTHSIRAMMKELPCAVIPGFYGSLPDGRIKTFTRGGSDITGALIAAALDADIYENWTDVDGLMSADPAVCSGAIRHPAVSYRQMRMMAHAGAQVLHPYCVEPVCEAGIPTVLKNTFYPDGPGSYISDQVRGYVPCICALHNYKAIYLNELDACCRQIAESFVQEVFVDQHGCKLIVAKERFTDKSHPVCIISIFGFNEKMHKEAVQLIQPLAEQHSEYYSRYVVNEEDSNDSQNILHGLVLRLV